MNPSKSRVFIVEDDASMRTAVKNLLHSVGLETAVFASADDFLETDLADGPNCLILDVRLPGLGGLDLQAELNRRNVHIPIIFMTAHGDIPMSVRAMKAGAVEFLTKPFRDQDLLDAIHIGLARDWARRRQQGELAETRRRYDSLTPRQRELLPLVISGRSNRDVANQFGTSEITIKVNRRNLMQKMRATSFADLFRMAAELRIPYTKV
jgi:FixJ family two-component response regulator